jgi:hypothetical protein
MMPKSFDYLKDASVGPTDFLNFTINIYSNKVIPSNNNPTVNDIIIYATPALPANTGKEGKPFIS